MEQKVKNKQYTLSDCQAGDCFYLPTDNKKVVYIVTKRCWKNVEYKQKYVAQGKGNPIKIGFYSKPIIYINNEKN